MLSNYADALADLHRAAELNSDDLSYLWRIPPDQVAKCDDEVFQSGLLELADQAVQRSDGVPAAHIARGLLLAALCQRDHGIADFQKAATRDDATYDDRYRYALTCLKLDDLAAYREACGAMLEKFAATAESREAYFTVWTCVLAPTGLAIGTRRQIWFLPAAPDLAARVKPAGEYDGCFLARQAHFTGPVMAHDLAWCGGELWVVNTLFSCLCVLRPEYTALCRAGSRRSCRRWLASPQGQRRLPNGCFLG